MPTAGAQEKERTRRREEHRNRMKMEEEMMNMFEMAKAQVWGWDVPGSVDDQSQWCCGLIKQHVNPMLPGSGGGDCSWSKRIVCRKRSCCGLHACKHRPLCRRSWVCTPRIGRHSRLPPPLYCRPPGRPRPCARRLAVGAELAAGARRRPPARPCTSPAAAWTGTRDSLGPGALWSRRPWGGNLVGPPGGKVTD